MENVVYCKYCKYYHPISETAFECGNIHGLLDPSDDDFCSKGDYDEARDLDGQIPITT